MHPTHVTAAWLADILEDAVVEAISENLDEDHCDDVECLGSFNELGYVTDRQGFVIEVGDKKFHVSIVEGE